MKHACFIFCSFFIICTSVTYPQTDLSLEYDISYKFKSPVHSVVSLRLPDGTKDLLYSDTTLSAKYFMLGYFTQSGVYLLTINFSDGDSINETIDYSFTLNKKEIDVNIDISFWYPRTTVKENEKWVDKLLTPQGFITVTKNYYSPESVSIVLDSIKSSKYYKGPFFKLTNNSNDTLYGKYLPGYFWGTLSHKNSDSIWQRESTGQIDVNFEGRPPLFPGSSTVATVGSFGVSEKLKEGNYRYSILYSIESTFGSKVLNKGNEKFLWLADTNEFYKLVYRFKVE